MENKIHSYNSRTSAALKQLLVPGAPQLLLDLTLGILILLVLNSRAIWHYFTRGITADSQVELGSFIDERAPFISDFLDRLSRGRFVQVVFWLFVGCVVYMIVWLIGNFITNIRNDIVADEYLHPKFYNRAGYWGSVVAHKVMFVCTVFILAAYIFAGAKLIVLLADQCYRALLQFDLIRSPAAIIISILVSALIIQILFFLLGFVRNTWRIIYKDL